MPRALQSQLYLNATYRWSDSESPSTLYQERLAEPLQIEIGLPEQFSGLPRVSQVRCRIKEIATQEPTVSEYTLADLVASQDIYGWPATAQLYDIDTSTAYLSLYGIVAEADAATGELILENLKLAALAQDLPKRRIIDIFPNADLSTAPTNDPRVIKCFKEMRQVRLTRLTNSSPYDYGAIVPSATIATVYRGRKVVTSGFTTPTVSGLLVVRFTQLPVDATGREQEIHVDITSSSFARPSDCAKWALEDTTDGLSQTVDSSSFTTAASDYAAASYSAGGGIGPEPIKAETLLQYLALRGATFGLNSSGAWTCTVDKSGLHTAAQYQGSAYGLGRGDGHWENIARVSSYKRMRLDQRAKSYTLQGLWTGGFGQGSYLLTATASRSLPSDAGLELPAVTNPMIGDITTLRKEAGYRFARMVAAEQRCAVEVINEARVVGLNQTVPITVPGLRIAESLLLYPWYCTRVIGSRDNWTLELEGYDAGQFTAQAGTYTQAPAASVLTDYSFTAPGAFTNLQTPTYTYDLDSQGNQIVVVRLQGDAPSVNVSAGVFRAKRWVGGSPTGITYAEQRIVCSAGATAVKAELTLAAGVKYDLELQSFNAANNTDYQYGAVATFPSSPVTIPKDTTGPGAPTGLSYVIRAGENRVKINATMPADGDVEIVRFYRGTDTNFANAVEVGYRYASASAAVSFEDQDVAFNVQLYYWARCWDFSDNPGTVSSRLDVDPIPPGRIAHTINPKKDKLFHFDFNAKSTQGLAPTSDSTFTMRGVEGKFGGAVAINVGRTNLLENGAFESNSLTSWTTSIPSGDSITVAATDHPDFRYQAELAKANNTASMSLQQNETYGSGALSAGEPFVATCYAKVIDLEIGAASLDIIMLDDLNNVVASASTDITDTDWHRPEVTLTVPSLGSPRYVATVRARIFLNNGETGVLAATGLQLERAGYSTSYTVGTRGNGRLNITERAIPVQEGTIGFWVYVRTGSPHSAADGAASVLEIRNAADASKNQIYFRKVGSSANWQLLFSDETGATAGNTLSSAVMAPGWRFVVFTWKRSTTFAQLFVDGESQWSSSSVTLPRTFHNSSSGVMWFGSGVGGTARWLDSMIDELFILPRLIKPQEALRWYRQNAPFYDPEAVERGQEMGPPANNFVTGSFTMGNTAIDSGGRDHAPHWAYTQPAPGSAELPAEGFFLYIEDGNITDPNDIDQQKISLGASVRDWKTHWGHVTSGTKSYAISAWRTSRLGVEETAKVNVASWRGVSIDNKIKGGGVDDNTLGTAKFQNLSVTNAKIDSVAANKIKTQNLTIDVGSTGADALVITNAGKLRFVVGTSFGDANIIFENSGGTELSKITAKNNNEVTFEPVTSSDGALLLGRDGVKVWDTVEIASDNRVHITAGAGGYIHLRSPLRISDYTAMGGTPGARVARVAIADAGGTLIGYMNLTAS